MIDITNESIEKICQKLQERSVVLFLGAGVNADIENGLGDKFPLGQDLSNLICKDLLGEESSNRTLEDSSEMAIHKWRPNYFNKYIYDKFNSFKPNDTHFSIVKLPWLSIYTTNFDNLIEKASFGLNDIRINHIKPVYSKQEDITDTRENETLYYKLHGCIDNANAEGKLILTKEDYRLYEKNRKPLFERLFKDLKNCTFLFIGYSMLDDNFRKILDDCRNALGINTLPLSYAVRPNFNENDKSFWKDKYNIQLINSTAKDFINLLFASWEGNEFDVIPFSQRKPKVLDRKDSFPLIGESFYQLRLQDCISNSDPKAFFNGEEPSWGDIRENYIPKRDNYDSILEAILEDIVSSENKQTTYLVTGAAGTGKTTLIKTLVYDIVKSFEIPVFYHMTNTPLDINDILLNVNKEKVKRIVIIINNPSSNIKNISNFIFNARKSDIPITVIFEDRLNQWMYSKQDPNNKIDPIEITLEKLSDNEIINILNVLREKKLLGKLEGSSVEYQIAHFKSLADQDLLVALKMLVNDGSFDKIIMDEFEKIPMEKNTENETEQIIENKAQKAYLYVSAFSQFDLYMRFDTLMKLLGLGYTDEISKQLFTPTTGILYTEEIGNSTTNYGLRFRTRHPQIATTIYSKIADSDEKKFNAINEILNVLDPGFREDELLIHKVIQSRGLIKTLASPEMQRALYERLENLLPENPYVYQHRSMLERELNNFEIAINFAKKALELNPENPAFLNTLGFAFEAAAWPSNDPLLERTYLDEAEKLFNKGIKINPESHFDYLGLIYILKQRISKTTDDEEKKIKEAELISLIDEAFEATQESSLIAIEKSKQYKKLGNDTRALEILNIAINRAPNNYRLRISLIILEKKQISLEKALETALEGEKLTPNSWQIQREIARIKKEMGHSVQSVKIYFENALKLNQGYVPLLVEVAAYYYMNGLIHDAWAIFNKIKSLPLPNEIKNKNRQWILDSDGNTKIFDGKIEESKGIIAEVKSIPENQIFKFLKTHSYLIGLKKGEKVKFNVCFNAHGPKAVILKNH